MPSTLRRILAIAIKELRVLLGQPKSRFMVLMPPIFQLFIFTFAATMEVRNVDVLIVDRDRGVWSAEIVNRLRGSSTFRNIAFAETEAEARTAIDRQSVLCVLSFQSDFSARIARGDTARVQVLLDGRRSNAAQILGQYLEQIVQDVAKPQCRGRPGARLRESASTLSRSTGSIRILSSSGSFCRT